MIDYAAIRENFDEALLSDGYLFWLPMVYLKYKSGLRKHTYLFDSFIAPSLGKLDLYVILLRNPKQVRIVSDNDVPVGEITLQPLKKGEEIINDLREFRQELTDKLSESYEKLSISDTKMAFASMLWFVSPSDIADYDTEARYYNMLMVATNLLDKIGIKKKSNINILEENVVYYPILIGCDKKTIYEPALKLEKSESLSAIISLPEIKELIFTKIL